MEPERKIEKWLRAFAKKRREQAGDAMELPASARERLHREISRREATGGGFFSSFFAGLRPRLAFAVCFIAVAAVSAWLLLPNLNRPKPASLAAISSTPANAPLANQPAPEAAPPLAVMPSPAARSEVARDVEKKPTTFAGTPTKRVQSAGAVGNPGASVVFNETPAPVRVLDGQMEQTNLLAGMNALSTTSLNQGILADKAGDTPADSFANSGALNKDSTDWAMTSAAQQINTNATMGVLTLAVAEPEARKKPGLAGAPASATAGGVVFDSLAKRETSPADTVASQRFYRVDIAARRSAKETPNMTAPLLTSFRIEQNGGEMRVVDADGSVYTGTVQMANDQPESHAVVASAFKSAPASSMTRTPLQNPAAQNYFFRVTGTNRNLRQNVVFSGNLIPLTNAVLTRTNMSAVSGLSGGGGGGAMPALTPSLLLNSRISGKAVIGNQTTIDVNATPSR
ncbi:MAG TPA: hypothetical protein VH597_13210 [Verrucomicrobiae bacterium]|jgi:hypothetical protein|nr:hypothetical protein [Verrucomicrobiae bacterium]